MATPSISPLPLTGDNLIDAATHGYYWQLGSNRTINWAVSNGLSGEFWYSPQAVADTVGVVLNNISTYANVRFNYVGFYSNPVTAYAGGSDITISLDASLIFGGNTSTWAVGFFPSASNGLFAGDIFLNVNSQANFLPSYAPGSAGYALLIHEIGHTLGLKHPFDSGGTGHPTLEQLGLEVLDKDWFTVMAYNDDYNYNLGFWDPATPMLLDVLALQYLYGPNTATHSGNTIYSLLLNNEYQTIWDAAGTDVIDTSQSAVSWEIQLPDLQLSALVDTRVGYAGPALDLTGFFCARLNVVFFNLEEGVDEWRIRSLAPNRQLRSSGKSMCCWAKANRFTWPAKTRASRMSPTTAGARSMGDLRAIRPGG